MINICNTDNKNNLNEIKIALEQCKLGNDALIIKNAFDVDWNQQEECGSTLNC